MFGQTEHAAKKVAADFHRSLPYPAAERLRTLEDEHPEIRTGTQQKNSSGRSRQRAPDDHHVIAIAR
jgi:hypothetical protein